MRKIINGRLYDTDTASKVGEYSYGYVGNFNYFCEALYCKRTGEYFIYGVGGAMSKYAESCGQNQWQGGSSIIPIGQDYARIWAENHLDADEYVAEFGMPEE